MASDDILDQWHNDGIAFAKRQSRLCGLQLATMRDCPDLSWAFWLGYKAERYRDDGSVPEPVKSVAAMA